MEWRRKPRKRPTPRRGLITKQSSLRHGDGNLAILHLHRVAGDTHVGILDVAAGLDVVAIAMPRTDHHVLFDLTFTQRPARMLAHVIESIDLAFEIEVRHFYVLDLQDIRGTRRNIRKVRHLDEIGHAVILY